MPRRVLVGTAGWAIPRASARHLPGEGTHLERYARVFGGVEINSSFYRPHAAATYGRWAAATPRRFRFAVKVPREITHERCLRDVRRPLAAFLAETAGLGQRRGPLLVQLPPSLEYDARVAGRFFAALRAAHAGPVVCEARHPTWFHRSVEALLAGQRVARVAADPPPVPEAARPGGWPGLWYFRLHGSPRTYWSRYDPGVIAALAATVRSAPRATDVWCVFDNTASGSAMENAWELLGALGAC
jgi:uncharacterized protein YecE (DUF72 family)